MTKNMRL